VVKLTPNKRSRTGRARKKISTERGTGISETAREQEGSEQEFEGAVESKEESPEPAEELEASESELASPEQEPSFPEQEAANLAQTKQEPIDSIEQQPIEQVRQSQPEQTLAEPKPSGGKKRVAENNREGMFESFSKISESVFSLEGVKKAAAWYIETSEKLANQALELQERATGWAKETPFAPLFEAQTSFARKFVERSASAARTLWQIHPGQ
jgi:hypothetical protein